MAQQTPEVKTGRWQRLLGWCDAHPRTGWYLMVVANLNLLLNLIDAFDLF